ncbi:MAG: TAXI family TRAP transporter solute-binding subunit [Rhodospirillaceae bacterium]|nr:TAXI family TRAP transporter solute-binding subunit [Rhodospirillaceae bacterium]
MPGVLMAAIIFAAPAPAQDVKVLRIATGPIDSTEFPFGGLVGNAISNPPGSRECDRGGSCGVPGLIANAQSTGGGLDNLKAVARGDIDLGLAQADVTNWAFYSVGDFEGQEPLTQIRVIARLYPSTVHLIARKGAKITSVKDLVGKKVAVDGEGTGTRFTVRAIFAAYGVKWPAVQTQVLDLNAATAALKGGKIDAMFMVSGAPVLALEDLSRSSPFEIVPIDGPTAVKLTQAFPQYSLGTIPAGTYGEHPAIATIDVGEVLIAREGLADELGFDLARAIWHERNKALFEAGHARGKLMDKKLATRGVGIPVQSGAARYYISAGVMAPPPTIAPAEPSKPLAPRPAARTSAPQSTAAPTPPKPAQQTPAATPPARPAPAALGPSTP